MSFRQDEHPDPELENSVVEPALEEAARASSFKLLVLFGVGVVLFLIVQFTPVGERVDDWEAMISGGGLRAAAFFVVLTAGLMAIGMPRLPFYVLAGFAFDFFGGLALALCGSLIGSFVMFRTARWAGRTWLVERFGTKPALKRVIGTKPTAWSVALVRMLPISNALINVGLSLSKVRNRAFLLGTLLGFLPQGIIATLIGAGVADDVTWEGAVQLGVAGLAILILLGWASHRLGARGTQPTKSNGH